MTNKETRKKYGLSGQPIPATRCLAFEMDHDFKMPAFAVLAINDAAGTFTSANVYGGNLGKGYDGDTMTHPLPAADSESWKKWRKKGYEEVPVATFDVLVAIKPKGDKPKAEVKTAAKV